jgi:hypothetical protein
MKEMSCAGKKKPKHSTKKPKEMKAKRHHAMKHSKEDMHEAHKHMKEHMH